MNNKTTNNEIKNNFITINFYNKIGFIAAALILILFFILNFFTPLLADDFGYAIGITSIKDILKSVHNMYYSWSGRSIANFVTLFWLLMGKLFFNTANTLVYFLFVLLFQFHIMGTLKKFNPVFFCCLNILLWYFVPAWGQNFLWLTGSCNYLWTATILLLFLVPFRKKIDNPFYKPGIPMSLLSLFMGILAGWTNENSGAAVLFLFILYFILIITGNRKFSLFEILGVTGFIIGFSLLVFAPGNYERIEYIRNADPSNDSLIITLIKRLIIITHIFIKNHGFIILGGGALVVFDMLFHQKKKINNYTYSFALAGIAGAYSMLLSPGFPDRAFLIIIIFLGIFLGMILVQLEPGIPKIIERNKLLFFILLFLVFLHSFLFTIKSSRETYSIWQQRIQYITAEKEKGNFDIEVRAPIPVTDRHVALYGLDDIFYDKKIWPNTSIAGYFGLKSIKKINDDVPW
ncbi:MAG: DUF6056 family protein [Treponema sp.]|nr:DUF6056 family protein [Treponema sp.]